MPDCIDPLPTGRPSVDLDSFKPLWFNAFAHRPRLVRRMTIRAAWSHFRSLPD